MKALRIILILLAATLLTVLALAGLLWFWIGASTSLATALNQASRYLPAGQTLEVKEVEGSLRGGGRIGWLRWQQGELSVEAREVRIDWSLRPLLDGELRLGNIAIQHLRIDDRRPPSTAAVPTPPVNLGLPFRVDVPFAVDTVAWVGPPALAITGMRGHYRFDGQSHLFDADHVQISSGQYNMKARLQAQAPMALSVQLQGSVQTVVPSSDQKITVQAHAEVKGQLAGRDATLEVQAQLVPELPALTDKKSPALQASITARLQPWQAQPVILANAHWQALDLAALWPQARQTLLSGQATVTPEDSGWRAGVQLDNAQSGPWDQQRLPIESLNAKVVFVAGQWTVESLQARGAGGRLEAQGQFADTPTKAATPMTETAVATWQGSASAFGINPALLDSRLAATALDGQLTAAQTSSGIAFDTRLQTTTGKAATQKITASKTDASRANTLAGLRLKNVQAQGLWQAPLLTLSNLTVQTDDAQLQGKLTFDTVSQATQGQLDLTLPGAHATLDGKIASTQGQGDINLRMTDAARATRWLARLPGAPVSLANTSIQGAAEFTGHWQGGWERQGQALKIQAKLSAPKLDLRTADQTKDQTLRLRDLQADLTGSLRAMTLVAHGQAEAGTSRFTLQTQMRGGRVSDGVWQAQWDTAQLTALDSQRPGTWTLKLNESVALNWQQSGTSQTLNVSSGTVLLSGPVPGTATINWQPARWSQQLTGRQGSTPGRTEWRTQGQLQGLPLAWLELLGNTQMDNLGLRGDLLFGGQWDATGGDTFKLRATLARTSGDLQLLTTAEDLASPSITTSTVTSPTPAASLKTGTLRAGVREARLIITAENDQLAANLLWDSERAGQVQASFDTRLQRNPQGAWTWPATAPLTGTMRVKLPPVGAWSLLAPPGWRLRGTLDADATLSGTRGAPQWRGTLRAQDLAVRSVVDGIDFSQGTLNASLNGERLDINEFTLQGAAGRNEGGLLTIKGSVLWLAPTGPDATLTSRLQMQLEATAEALRVSARADRRLVVSGKLSAQLKDAQLSIRGTLKADRARFVLPEDTTPQLGNDVRVRAPQTHATPTPPRPKKAGVQVVPDVAITLDLGDNFQVRGRGLITRLAGQLELRSNAALGSVPRLNGEVRIVRGTYKAYGQQLDIEEGVLRFTGPLDNPSLDILAIRPNLQQRVGVQISGTALSPIVRLYAEPDLPDAEKLSWLVLGRSAAGGGAEAAVLQQAALALLGGNGQGLSGGLAQALGLDELSMSGATTNADGSTTTGATVTLGKRISRDFYVAYERSLAGTLGTFYIFYDLSRRFTLRAQTGEQSAVDLIFTVRYD